MNAGTKKNWRKKLSIAIRLKWKDPIYRNNVIKTLTGKKQSKETILKRIMKTKGKKRSHTFRVRMSILLTGKKHSKEQNKRQSEFMKKYYLTHSGPNLNRKFSYKSRKKMSVAQYKFYSIHKSSNIGRKRSEETRKKISLAQIGKRNSEETRRRISEANKGRIPWNKNKIGIYSEEHRKKISESSLGRIVTKETRLKISLANKGKPGLKGKKNRNWKGGITPIYTMIRNLSENKEWIKKVFEHDFFICQECFKRGGYLEAHHKKAFALILQEFLQEYNQFSPIEDKETLVRLAFTYKPFWDINNGVTLCKKCHSLIKKSNVFYKNINIQKIK